MHSQSETIATTELLPKPSRSRPLRASLRASLAPAALAVVLSSAGRVRERSPFDSAREQSVKARGVPALPRVPAATPRGTGDGVPRHARVRGQAAHHALPARERLVGRPVPGLGSARAPLLTRPRAIASVSSYTRRPRGEERGHCGPPEPPYANARLGKEPPGGIEGRALSAKAADASTAG